MSTGRAACASRGACVRLFLLVGIATVAWLAWGAGTAHSGTGPEAEGSADSALDMIAENTAVTEISEAPEELEATEYPDAPEGTETPEVTVDEETVHTEDTVAREDTEATVETVVDEDPVSAEEPVHTEESAHTEGPVYTEEPVHTEDNPDEGTTGENRLSDTVARVGSTTEYLTEQLVPRVTSLPGYALDETGVTSALEASTTGEAATRAVDDTVDVVDDTARGAGRLVGEVARTGQDAVDSTDDSLSESRLVGTVTSGLSNSPQVVNDRVNRAVNPTVPGELPALVFTGEPGTDSADSAGPEAERSDADGHDGSERAEADTDSAQMGEPAWRDAATEAVGAAVAAEQATDDSSEGHFRPMGEGPTHSAGSDATGASAPSFPAPGAAGYLVPRADHIVPQGQGIALPGDPALAVRDAADDPSFSPD